MREVKGSTKRGQQLIAMGSNCCHTTLSELYDKWSRAKEEAYKWCCKEYYNSENARGFGIGNANTFGFTASWLCTIDGEEVMRIETKDNSYIVWLNK